MNKLLLILQGLDPNNDAHWTQDGAARLDYVSDQMGSQVTRAMITEIAPKFNRANTDVVKPQQPVNPFAKSDALAGGVPSNNGVSDKPEMLDDGQGSSLSVEGDNQLNSNTDNEQVIDLSIGDYEKRVELEYKDARNALESAQRRMQRANAAMDELILSREKSNEASSFTHNVQRYLKSQCEEQHRTHMQQEQLKQMIQGLQTQM